MAAQLVLALLASAVSGMNLDFVDHVECLGKGINITLKPNLPIPVSGQWDLEVERYEHCRWAKRPGVMGGMNFFIAYSNDDCGISPKSYFEPAIVSNAKVTLILRDGNETSIGDYISCVYKTRFSHSLSFSDARSENLIQQGALERATVELENTVQTSDAITMDFFNPAGNELTRRVVKMGDPLVFKIDVSESDTVTRVLPEKCYFSPSPNPDFEPEDGTLTFINKNCFNDRNGIVRQMLPTRMERNGAGTTYHLDFNAFYFTNYGSNLYVHCILLTCIGDQSLCEPEDDCFSMNRRKRNIEDELAITDGGQLPNEVFMTKYILVEDRRAEPKELSSPLPQLPGSLCLETTKFAILFGSMGAAVLMLIVAVSCMGGRLMSRKVNATMPAIANSYGEKHLLGYYTGPPSYGVQSVTPF